MRLLSISFAVLATLGLDPCTGGGGGAGENTPAQPAGGDGTNTGGGTNGGGGTNTGGATANVDVPEIFYEKWEFTTITSYPDDGSEPKVTGLSGFQQFERTGEYAQNYTVGSLSFVNDYHGTYRVIGPDPRVAGAFKIETTDQESQKQEWGVAVDDGTEYMALTLYKDDGSPSIIMGAKVKR